MYERLVTISNITFSLTIFILNIFISLVPQNILLFRSYKKISFVSKVLAKLEKYKVSSISISIEFSTNDNSETIEQNARRQTLEQTRAVSTIHKGRTLFKNLRASRNEGISLETSPFSLNCTILPATCYVQRQDNLVQSSWLFHRHRVASRIHRYRWNSPALSQIIVTIVPGIGYSVRSWDCGLDWLFRSS